DRWSQSLWAHHGHRPASRGKRAARRPGRVCRAQEGRPKGRPHPIRRRGLERRVFGGALEEAGRPRNEEPELMKDSNPPVVILCGGKGTRLGDLAKSKPKPLVPIGGMPILWHIMKGYAHQGYKDFVLCLGYKGELIEEFFVNGTIAGEPVAQDP